MPTARVGVEQPLTSKRLPAQGALEAAAGAVQVHVAAIRRDLLERLAADAALVRPVAGVHVDVVAIHRLVVEASPTHGALELVGALRALLVCLQVAVQRVLRLERLAARHAHVLLDLLVHVAYVHVQVLLQHRLAAVRALDGGAHRPVLRVHDEHVPAEVDAEGEARAALATLQRLLVVSARVVPPQAAHAVADVRTLRAAHLAAGRAPLALHVARVVADLQVPVEVLGLERAAAHVAHDRRLLGDVRPLDVLREQVLAAVLALAHVALVLLLEVRARLVLEDLLRRQRREVAVPTVVLLRRRVAHQLLRVSAHGRPVAQVEGVVCLRVAPVLERLATARTRRALHLVHRLDLLRQVFRDLLVRAPQQNAVSRHEVREQFRARLEEAIAEWTATMRVRVTGRVDTVSRLNVGFQRRRRRRVNNTRRRVRIRLFRAESRCSRSHPSVATGFLLYGNRLSLLGFCFPLRFLLIRARGRVYRSGFSLHF